MKRAHDDNKTNSHKCRRMEEQRVADATHHPPHHSNLSAIRARPADASSTNLDIDPTPSTYPILWLATTEVARRAPEHYDDPMDSA